MVLKKTKTARKRAVTIYAPSERLKAKWYAKAKEHNVSVSTFVFEIVEDFLKDEGDLFSQRGSSKIISDLEKRNKTLSVENQNLQKKVDMLNMLTDRFEKQLQSYRNKTFIENGKFEGVREYQRQLIDLFKQKKTVKEDELLDLLHLATSDSDTIKAVSKQIENLVEYDILGKIPGGWRWKG